MVSTQIIKSIFLLGLFQEQGTARSKSAAHEKLSSTQDREAVQGNLKKALETIAFIMNGSIKVDVCLDSESAKSLNLETELHLNSEVSTEQDVISESCSEANNCDVYNL